MEVDANGLVAHWQAHALNNLKGMGSSPNAGLTLGLDSPVMGLVGSPRWSIVDFPPILIMSVRFSSNFMQGLIFELYCNIIFQENLD